jgi:hypothetical protein
MKILMRSTCKATDHGYGGHGNGEFTEKTLSHEGNEVREFYAALEGPVVVGSETTRHAVVFATTATTGRVGDRVPGGSSGEDSGSRDPETEA